MKVSIIGAGGLVGSCAAFALQCGGLAREIALLDINQDLAAGHALDLQHGGPSVADQVITGGGYEHIPTSDVICITAGLRRKPDESRLDLINRNTDLFVQILKDIKAAGPKSTAIVVVVSNPVDILTYVAAQKLGLPSDQVIGLGTQLDTIRFCSLIAEQLSAPPTQTKALILGEHGESMVPIWSSAAIAGLPLDKYPGWSPTLATQLFTRTRGSGAEVIKRKGGAGFAVGIAIRDVIDAVILDQRCVLPVSSVQNGCFGVRDVALSVPTVVGRAGVLDR
ncbi:MAG: lactate/malate dehydrogenase family protein, partial [Planctomycetota bacterium]